MEIKVLRDPYRENDFIYKKDTLNVEPGIYVLIGHNGSGKTTLLKQIKNYCNSKKIPTFTYDNYKQGGIVAKAEYGRSSDINNLAFTLIASEGQQIFNNFSNILTLLGNKVTTATAEGKTEMFILLDALDSGLDVDGIEQIMEGLDYISKDIQKNNIKPYIFITANNYALVHKRKCINVIDFTEHTFNDYETYKDFILKQWKELRRNK